MTSKARAGGLLLMSGVSGVVIAHVVAYVVAIPDGGQRARYLDATGHGYWPVATGLAIAAGVAAIAGSGLRGRARALAGMDPCRGVGVRGLLAITAWQGGLFTVMEVAERIGAGSPTSALIRSPAFLVGLGIQALVALAVASILWGIERGVQRLVTATLRDLPAIHVLRPFRLGRSFTVLRWTGGGPEARGPPLTAFC